MPSSVIKSYHYFPETETLRIVYVSGTVYDYLDAHQQVFDDFRAAFSKGVFLNRSIKPNYAFRKVSG